MRLIELKNKRVTVLGLGLLGGGVGVVKALASVGAHVVVTDIKTKDQLAPSLALLSKIRGVEYVLGQHRDEDFTRADLVVKSPGILWTHRYVQLALSHNVPVHTDASLFFQLCKNPIIGVTGTKGKTTTTYAIDHLLRHAGVRSLLVGADTTSVLDRLALLKDDSVVVFELSSWRLSAFDKIAKSPHIAVFTSFFPDHMNYYKTVDAYFFDKSQIFLHQKSSDFCVYPSSNERISSAVSMVPSRAFSFGVGSSSEFPSLSLSDDTIVYYKNADSFDVLCDVSSLLVSGEHFVRDLLAAASAVLCYGVHLPKVVSGLKTFAGVPHRMEVVRTINGVRYVNDTTATVPEASIAALKSFSSYSVYLIAGGSDKNLDFSSLGRAIADYAKGVVFLKGAGTDKLLLALKVFFPEEESRSFVVVESMGKAVEILSRQAHEGDVVLLSPGAASFGLFANEFDRGEQFRAVVEAL
ncbi:MAG: UDP-N-acetylmuramoyl-L-alanine--D-glutamate ligase [Candidatus Moranbacteria bacterium]|nr:UDP-N-acetylmuramoyl-L-alanine--D-glutamate ligase [Candidatus Moranbacteria bacterium]